MAPVYLPVMVKQRAILSTKYRWAWWVWTSLYLYLCLTTVSAVGSVHCLVIYTRMGQIQYVFIRAEKRLLNVGLQPICEKGANSRSQVTHRASNVKERQVGSKLEFKEGKCLCHHRWKGCENHEATMLCGGVKRTSFTPKSTAYAFCIGWWRQTANATENRICV
mgnify:CR=1 FL=1